MLEPRRLQSTATVVRAQQGNGEDHGIRTSAKTLAITSHKVKPYCYWCELKCRVLENGITRSSHPSAGPLDPLGLNVRALAVSSSFFFFSYCKFDSLRPSIFQSCMRTIRSLLICSLLLILPFCRCIAIGILHLTEIDQKLWRIGLCRNSMVFVLVIEPLCE